MAHRWGNDDHGPGGDPSWLGGKDRGGADATGSDTWSSGFGSGSSQADSDVGARRDPQAAEQMTPRFGDATGEETVSPDRDAQSSWSSDFAGQNDQGGSRSDGGSMARQLFGVLISVVVLGIVVVVLMNMGMDSWWFLLFAGLPLIMRVVRIIRQNLGS